MATRTRSWVVVGAPAFVAAVAFGVLAAGPQTPYRFLRGAKYEGAAAVSSFDGRGAESLGSVRRCYRSGRPSSEVAAMARAELSPSDGWSAPASVGDAVQVTSFSNADGERVWIESGLGGTLVYMVSPATPLDRAGLWLRGLWQ
jgi:hypothetical protein